jgi:hypothetical protein
MNGVVLVAMVCSFGHAHDANTNLEQGTLLFGVLEKMVVDGPFEYEGEKIQTMASSKIYRFQQ